MANLEFHTKRKKKSEINIYSEKRDPEKISSSENPLNRHNKGYFF